MELLVKDVIAVLRSELDDLEGVYLFGSRAMGQFDRDSDWDFGYLSRKGMYSTKQWEIISDLSTKYDTSIDLVDLFDASTVLQIEVLKHGEVIWHADKNKIATFEYLVLSFYQKLNEERAEILEDIKARGSIYG